MVLGDYMSASTKVHYGNQPLSEPILIKNYFPIRCHQGLMSKDGSKNIDIVFIHIYFSMPYIIMYLYQVST